MPEDGPAVARLARQRVQAVESRVIADPADELKGAAATAAATAAAAAATAAATACERTALHRSLDHVGDCVVAAAACELKRDPRRPTATRVRVQMQRRRELDERLRHLVAAVEGGLVERRVAPIGPVGRREVGTHLDEALSLGGVICVAGNVVELAVERACGWWVSVRSGLRFGGTRRPLHLRALRAHVWRSSCVGSARSWARVARFDGFSHKIKANKAVA
eukprot:scaffold93181_cov54-Phaeocystis_antarctica.AAC.3